MNIAPTTTLFACSLACALTCGDGLAQGSVNLFENAWFAGQAWPIPLQPFAQARNQPLRLSSTLNDKVSSLQWALDPNISVTFYEHPDGSGERYHIAYDAPRIGSDGYVGAVHNDRFSALSWQLDDPGLGGTVTVHEHPGLTGEWHRLPLSSYDEGALHPLFGIEDEVSSVQWDIQPNVVVTFYEHADGSGREYSIRHDAARVGTVAALPGNYNDKFSSWRWRYVDPSQGWLKCWTDANYTGYQWTRYVSETGFTSLSLPALGINDQIDSFRWSLPIGTTILLYDKAPAGGACYSLTGTGQRDVRQSNVFHDKISTVQVVSGDLCADGADRNRAYDRNTYLASHNAHCNPPSGWTVWNQDLSVISQLDYGARCLQLDTQVNNGVIHLVHGSWTATLAQRLPGTTPQTLHNLLGQIEVWMSAHPREVLTLVFENHDGVELADYLLNQSPIKNKLHLQERGSWPSINELLAQGKRYVIWNMRAQAPGLPWQYSYCVENDYGGFGSVNPRSESQPIDRLSRSLFFMNNISPIPPSLWPPFTTPNTSNALANLGAQFTQAPNFIGVDRIREGGEGGLDYARFCNVIQWPARESEASAAEFGSFTCGARRLQAITRPLLGTTLQMEASQVLPGPSAVEFLIYGASDVSLGGLPLPFALPLEPSCTVRVSAEIIVGIAGVGQVLPVPVALPNTPALIGAPAFFQTIGYEPSNDEFVMSNGMRVRLGTL